MKNISKKGFELAALVGLGVTFVVIAIVMSFGGTILGDLSDNQADTASDTITNETVSDIGTETNTALGQSGRWGLQSCTLVRAYNATEGDELIPNGNFSITSDATANTCIVNMIDYDYNALIGNTSDFNFTYTTSYLSGKADYNSTQYGLESVETFSGWLPTLALIVIAAVIIGIIVRYFMVGGTTNY